VITTIFLNYNEQPDKDIQIINRYLNYPEQTKYTDSDIQLIVYGDVNTERK